MSTTINRRNVLPEFVELRATLVLDQSEAPKRFIRVDLRIQPCEIEDLEGETVAMVSIVRAVLSLDLDGLEVDGGTRLGEPVKETSLSVKTALKETTASSCKVGGNASLGASLNGQPDASFKAEAGGSRERTTSITREVNLEEHHIYVKARGNDTWEVTEPNGAKLDGTYLNNEKLCEFILRRGANHLGVTSSVEIRQRDLSFDFSKSKTLSIVSNNKKKLAGILIAKSLNPDQASYTGKIAMSSSEDEYE